MVAALVRRGLVAGLVGGLLAFAFAHTFGETSIDRAIGFENARDAALGLPPDPALVSRGVQSSVGLLTAVCVYGLAFGGLFALAFAAAHGRIGRMRSRVTSAVLAAAGYAVVFAVPFVKYPANPPSVGNPDTIGRRTELYLAMIAISVLAAIAAYRAGRTLAKRWGGWNGAVAAAALYLVVVVLAGYVLPGVHEVPKGFPAETLWHFRLASLGTQATLWAAIGLGFGALVERMLAPARREAKELAEARQS
jgi:hypothetical protein